MGRNSDNAPVGQTCPKIDEVISYLSSLDHIQDSDELLLVINVMEQIRDANSKLRDWGNQELRDKETFEADLETANNQIENLKYSIDELKAEISKLESELDDYKHYSNLKNQE